MKIYIIILLMAVVTYIPRFLPMQILSGEKIPDKIKSFLYFIPYAALGALIIPGGIDAINGKPVLSVTALCFTAIVSWYAENIIITLFSSIIFVYLVLKVFR